MSPSLSVSPSLSSCVRAFVRCLSLVTVFLPPATNQYKRVAFMDQLLLCFTRFTCSVFLVSDVTEGMILWKSIRTIANTSLRAKSPFPTTCVSSPGLCADWNDWRVRSGRSNCRHRHFLRVHPCSTSLPKRGKAPTKQSVIDCSAGHGGAGASRMRMMMMVTMMSCPERHAV